MSVGTVALGGQGLRVPRIGFGCLALSGVYGEVDDSEAIRAIQSAIDAGSTFVDTADVYGPFSNERLVGRALEGRRDGVVLATKFGNVVQPDGTRVVDGSPEHARSACEESLRRLRTDRIDLYYLHRVDKEIPIEETVGGMAQLVEEGKVRFIGLSEAAAGTIERAHATHPLTALQSEYSLWERDLERKVLPTIRELGIGLVAFSPLGRGFLAGGISSEEELSADDGRRILPRFRNGNLERNLKIVAAVKRVAGSRSATPGQVALAWLLAQGDDVVPIPGTRSLDHLAENIEAAELELSHKDVAWLSAELPPGVAAGERYPPDFLARLDQDSEDAA